ncbi:hypothetical protein [Nocardia sp. NPDC005978]|uniref:hypothetical protein n=1 Tax=unclassified Nocardia TaxID=2637762 RepID=UPI0033B66EB2
MSYDAGDLWAIIRAAELVRDSHEAYLLRLRFADELRKLWANDFSGSAGRELMEVLEQAMRAVNAAGYRTAPPPDRRVESVVDDPTADPGLRVLQMNSATTRAVEPERVYGPWRVRRRERSRERGLGRER